LTRGFGLWESPWRGWEPLAKEPCSLSCGHVGPGDTVFPSMVPEGLVYAEETGFAGLTSNACVESHLYSKIRL